MGASEVRVCWVIEWSHDWFLYCDSGLELVPEKERTGPRGGVKILVGRGFLHTLAFSSVPVRLSL